MSLTDQLFSAANGEAGVPALDFAPVQKTNLDLFARAPQVKRLSRREKQRLGREAAVQEQRQRRHGGGAVAARQVASSPDKHNASAGDKAHDVFETVFAPDEVAQVVEANKTGRGRRSRRKLLRHALHPNEEEDARTVFVGNLPNTIHQREVAKLFKSCGPVESVRVRCQALEPAVDEKAQNAGRAVRVLRGDVKKDDTCSATAYVLFKNADAVAEAVRTKNGVLFHERHLVVTSMTVQDRVYPPETSIFIGNIAHTAREEDVWNYFHEHGIADVKRVRLVRDRDSGACKGFGYVEFYSRASVEPAIATRGALLLDRPIRIVHVNKAKEVKTVTASRRERRRGTTSSGDAKDGRTSRDVAAGRKRGRTSGDGADDAARRAKRVRQDGSKEPRFPWMGVVTNARKKIPRDLRPLAEGGSKREVRKAMRAPVKHKLRNPEKHPRK